MTKLDVATRVIIASAAGFVLIMLVLVLPDYNERQSYQKTIMPSLKRQLATLENIQKSQEGAALNEKQLAELKEKIEEAQEQLRDVIREDAQIGGRISGKVNGLFVGIIFFVTMAVVAHVYYRR